MRLKSEAAKILCMRNVRFLTGLLIALGYNSIPGLSIALDMLGCQAVMRALLGTFERREVHAGRRYQVDRGHNVRHINCSVRFAAQP